MDYVINAGVLEQYNGTSDVIRIPEGVMEIHKDAFQKDDRVTEIRMPLSMAQIPLYFFAKFPNLERVTIPPRFLDYELDESLEFQVYAYEQYGLPQYLAVLGFPEGTREIMIGLPEECKIGELIIPGSVGSLSVELERSWRWENGVKTLTIGDGVKEIGDDAFELCSDLESVTIPGSVRKIGSRAFACCPDLKKITVCNGVQTISDHAFASCGNLTSVEIPDSVTKFPQDVFFDCVGLTSIHIPEHLLGKCWEDMFGPVSRKQEEAFFDGTARLSSGVARLLAKSLIWGYVEDQELDCLERLLPRVAEYCEDPGEVLEDAVCQTVSSNKPEITALLLEWKSRICGTKSEPGFVL